jgi:Protein of unknown function (DUF1588)/Protein of unknown function (DUF1595)/Protein of unknown function (DUF1592)
MVTRTKIVTGGRWRQIVAIGVVCFAMQLTPAAAQTTASAAADQSYQSLDTALYATAKQYFPSDAAGIPGKRLFRLTRDQIDATVKSLLPSYALPSIKTVVGRDALQTNYEYAELLSFNGANTTGVATWARDIAARVRKNPTGVIACAAGDANTDCRAAAARRFVSNAFRGDVTDDKLIQFVMFYLGAVKAAGPEQAAGDLVQVVLNSPGFLFRKELETNAVNRLSPAQLLQAVTYTIADQPPEPLGFSSEQAAQFLKSGNDAGATIGSVLASGAAREKLVRFFQAWLEIKEPGEFAISAQVFPEFTPAVETAVREATLTFLRTQLSKTAPRLQDITQATQFSVTAAAAPVYSAPAQRLGIFSQSAFIASHSGPTDTRPIKRGVFWVRKAMCLEMEPPPKDLHAKLYDLVGATERQRIEQSTSGPACVGCHKIINPFAFFQENYDAIGRWRARDNGVPIDASILINFLDEEPSTTTGPVDALKVLTSSMMFKQCFVRQLFRFYMGRSEEPADDLLLRRIFFEFARDDRQDIVKAVQMLVSSDRIVRRK